MRWKISRRAVVAAAVVAVLVIVIFAAPDALASAIPGQRPGDLNTVVNRITRWLVGLAAALATLFLTVGGIRYLLAGGDPGEVGKAKDTLKYAAIGYGVAVLAPLLTNILKSFVG